MTNKPYLQSPAFIAANFANLADIAPLLTKAEALVEADRCLNCYNAPCTRACPTHIDVPAFIKKIASGNMTGSARVIFDANPIGATCARVCPTSELCEGACVENTLLRKPIQIGRLQRYATDAYLATGRDLFHAAPETGKSVGIIGAGPAGLSCASYLARLGYNVVIYDKRELPGGLDTYAMAEYKMTMADSLAEIEPLKRLGIRFKMGTTFGTNVRTDYLLDDLMEVHEAIFIAVGLGAMTRLNVPGEDLPGVIDALEYIERIKAHDWESVPMARTVAVIGAGNTAVDAATQAKRLGAENVVMIYRRTAAEMPAYPYEFELAKSDGVGFQWQAAPVTIVAGEDGRASAVRCVQTVLDAPDAAGRVAVSPVPNSEFDIPCDLVIKAVGQSKQTSFLATLPGVATDAVGRVVVNHRTMQTGNPRIFAGGDCVNGGREAVDAAQMGKRAAQGIHHSLTGETVRIAGLWGLDESDEAPTPGGATAWGGSL